MMMQTRRAGSIKALWRNSLMIGLFSLLAACASSGASGGGARDAPLRPPVVTDPAPIVSGTMRPYQIRGKWYRPAEQPDYNEVGIASWYGAQFNGRPTATGERFDMTALTAAHKTLPLPGLVEVTNLENNRRIVVRVNDRGPFVDDRIIDLSRAAADELGLLSQGLGRVRVRYLGRAPRSGGGGTPLQMASVTPAPPPPPAAASGSGPRPYYSAPAPLPAPAPSQPVISTDGGYWVRAGAYRDQREAERIARRLGERASVRQSESSDGRSYAVMVGPWQDVTAATLAREAVAARGFGDALLISSQ